MLTLDAFLRQIDADPQGAAETWLVLADWLEERDDPRSELVRLLHQPDYTSSIEERNARLRPLLDRVPPLFENSLNMHFAWVPPGSFWMGGGGGTCGEQQVQIEQGFALGVFPVTQGQWQAIMGSNPSFFSRTGDGKDRIQGLSDEDLLLFPVERVSWEDAQLFLQKLNEKEGGSGWTYRLPSEAEWEYACRGAASSKEDCSYHFYLVQPSNDLSSDQANFNGNYPEGNVPEGPFLGRPTQVGSCSPNVLGVYDLHGNVWEWCQDLYDEEGSRRVVRGGGWFSYGSYCRAADRVRGTPSNRSGYLGLRVARAFVR